MIQGTCHCGKVSWRFEGDPDSALACNCTVCRRYGTLWAYGHEGENIFLSGETHAYRRADSGDLGFHFCPDCGCLVWWHPVEASERPRMGVNLRLAEPDQVAHLPLRHLDGFDTWKTVPRQTQRVADIWF